MILISSPLSEADFNKAKSFLARIKPLLASNECQFALSEKNKKFNRQYPMKDANKIKILKDLVPEDCVKIESNDNPCYEESEVYVFIKLVEILVFGETEPHKLYIKMYLREHTTFDVVIVISFHEEGMHD